MKLFSQDLAVDLGTANTLVYTEKQGIVVNEPSVVAVDAKAKKIVAVGKQAQELYRSSPKGISLVRPLLCGVIADFDLARKMIAHFIRKARSLFFFKDLAGHLYSYGHNPGREAGCH